MSITRKNKGLNGFNWTKKALKAFNRKKMAFNRKNDGLNSVFCRCEGVNGVQPEH